MGIACPYPLKSEFRLCPPARLCRQASGRRIRASMYRCAMLSLVQGYTFPPTPVQLSLWACALWVPIPSADGARWPNRVASGAEVVNVHRY